MSSTTMPKKKASRGRQKIEIKELEKQSTKEVTFSKRRTGLFKKASELCILCGVEVGIVVFSPARKPYCFGHPNIESLLHHYLNNNTSYKPAKINYPVHEYNDNYEKAVFEFKEEKKRAVIANDEMVKKEPMQSDMHWLDEDIENINIDELHGYLTALQELRKKLWLRYESLRAADNNAMVIPGGMSHVGYGSQFGGELNGGFGSAFFGGGLYGLY